MENATKETPFGVNPFSQIFLEFDEEAFFTSLHQQVRNKPYFEKYKGFKITVSCLSYVFNLGSALTASYAVFWLTQWITGFAIVGYLISAIFLFFLEQIKRKSSTELWQTWFFRKELAIGWLCLSLFCFAISLASSSFGVKQGTEELAPDTELLKADSLQRHYEGEIAQLEAKNEDLRNNRNSEGITFYKLADGITANELIIADYRRRTLALEKKTDGKNEQLTSEYQEEVEFTAWTLVGLTLLMELLFEACIAYIWYYKLRSYVEKAKEVKDLQKTYNSSLKDPQKRSESPPESSPPPSEAVQLLAEIQRLQSENESLRTNATDSKSVQNCTKMEAKETERHTVPHTYTKGGRTITTHYTLPQVKARIAQYKRSLEQAEASNASEDTLEHRKHWVNYWEAKAEELKQKTNDLNPSLQAVA